LIEVICIILFIRLIIVVINHYLIQEVFMVHLTMLLVDLLL